MSAPVPEWPHDAGTPVDWSAVVAAGAPAIVRGAAADWPLVRAGLRDPAEAASILRGRVAAPIVCYRAPAAARGRFFYDATGTAMTFTATRAALGDVLDEMLSGGADADALYIGSTDTDRFFPGLRSDNDLAAPPAVFADHPPTVSLWIGNRTVAATHFDASHNIACNLVGHRRFTLFPPEQIANLYPGPLSPTPGGQIVSLVDVAAPDHPRFPRYAAALETALIADLGPGDALFYPMLWWHNVEALDGFNIMTNYWWTGAAAHLDNPMTTVLHGMLALRDRPAAERDAWRHLFDHYVFADPEDSAAHIPPPARGPLARLDPNGARRLRAEIIERLNR